MPYRTIALTLGVLLAATLASPAHSSIAELRDHVEFLASEELGGRLTGTAGERAAAEYIASELTKLGGTPLPGQDSLRIPFEFTAGTKDAGSQLTLKHTDGEKQWSDVGHVQALSFSDEETVSGPVVFVGYGLVVPEGQGFSYDSYATLDVTDKIVVALRYFPEDVDQETRSALARYSGLRYKAMQARERGAKALILVTGPKSPNAGETVKMTSDTAVAGSGIVGASVSGEVAEVLFDSVEGKTLESAQTSFDDGNPHVIGFEIPGVEIELSVAIERESRTGENVAALFAATGDTSDKPYVLLGAHYDHLGRGDGGNSLAKKEEAGEIHYGADDNASGVSAVLEIAEDLAARERQRNLVVVFWSGEELGLLGANDFVRSEAVPLDEIAAYVNLDMVGRVRNNKLTVQALGSSPAWAGLIERSNVPVGFDLQTVDDPYLPTDSSAFNTAGVPTLNLFSGSHEDYHRPTDRAELLNYEELDRVTRFGTLLVGKTLELEDPPEFVVVERSRQEGGDRDSLRAFTGTIPDYSDDVVGLLLSGVVGGGPADEAGLQGGDIIVEMAGQSITNIYDYTYALDAIKIGEPAKIVFLRGEERKETTITPTARD